jgi:choice-of-anchor A domain-containing protein
VKHGRRISRDPNIDTQSYLDMFDELAIKSEYWSTLEPNGIIYPAAQKSYQNPEGNRLIFAAGDDRCLQVFHADRFDLYGLNGINVEFDPSLAGKTILINVASTYNSKSGKKEVLLDNWGKMYDTSGKEQNDRDFQSSTKASILWNFYDADVVTMGPGGGVQFPGSILIPNGDLYFYWPGHGGRLIVGGDVWHDRYGSEFHNYEFDPPVCGLPECRPPTTPPCPEDVIRISLIGDKEYPEIPIRIVKQNVGTVTFEVVNTFNEKVDRIYTQYHTPPVGSSTCVETTWVGKDEVAVYTAHCLKSNSITIVQVWVSDGSFNPKKDIAVVDECCHPTPYDTNGKVQYTFQIRCVSECPEIAR